MAEERMLRRGLPRVRGGEPWPPGGAVAPAPPAPPVAPVALVAPVAPVAPVTLGADTPHVGRAARRHPTRGVSAPDVVPAAGVAVGASVAEGVETRAENAVLPGSGTVAPAEGVAGAGADVRTMVRRGLPRIPGGEPWPPAAAPVRSEADTPHVGRPAVEGSTSGVSAPGAGGPAGETDGTPGAAGETGRAPGAGAGTHALPDVDRGPSAAAAMRRGLPRTSGGDPWPPAIPAPRTPAPATPAPRTRTPPIVGTDAQVALRAAEPPILAARTATGVGNSPVATLDVTTPLPWTRTVWPGRAPRHGAMASAAASVRRRPTWTRAIAILFGAAALGILAGAAVAFVRALLSLPFMQDFLAAFPGEYEPTVPVEPGFAPWIGWQHFFNVFLMVLIIRSGLRIRSEKRPTAFWTPRNNPKGKISLTIWFHQALDILWLVNGVIFVVLLFATGHWVRIVPTSWEVVPNALSAALLYASFDWPYENGWANYNSLQQLAYFTTVFVAAPLAAVTGFRMSGMWPRRAERLSRAYPVEWARAVHFPVMLYFVLFIVVHVALVMLTGFLRNLNHVYASQDAVTWTGFWVFVASLVIIAAGWAAARPLVIAPIAKLFGSVSGR